MRPTDPFASPRIVHGSRRVHGERVVIVSGSNRIEPTEMKV